MTTEETRKHARNWLDAADRVSLIGYAPSLDDEICVTVIVASHSKLPTPEDDPSKWQMDSATIPRKQ